MLSLENLTVTYGDTVAVDDVTLHVDDGVVLGVLGPSGSGKSTLLRAVAGLEPVAHGRIVADGRDLRGVPTHKRGFALMFQDGQLFAHQTVGQNVAYPLRIRRMPRAAQRSRVGELLELVGLGGYEDRLPATLSGGERQRVALARALSVEPSLLLLDEPLSALDASLRARLATELRQILKQAGTTALMVTHDQEEAFAVADRIAVMRAGELVQEGLLTDVWQHPVDVETALFLGYAAVLTGERAALVARTSGVPVPTYGLAVRRSAFVATGVADADFVGTVVTAAATPELWRLTVDVPELGVLDAVARLGVAEVVPVPGDRVGLRVDPARTAAVGPRI